MQAVTVPIEILLVEDNPGDVRLTQEALKEMAVPYRLSVARDGAEAIDFLQRNNHHGAAPRPDLILLDLNLPIFSGHEVLDVIKKDPDLRIIPVIVMSTSQEREDVRRSYDKNAACYLRKPHDLTEFYRLVAMCERFWLTFVSLPPRPMNRRQSASALAG